MEIWNLSKSAKFGESFYSLWLKIICSDDLFQISILHPRIRMIWIFIRDKKKKKKMFVVANTDN